MYNRFQILKIFIKIKNLLDLKEDFDISGAFDSIKSGVEFKSGNAWSLIFAIFIASIGLQTNSTAVIIGAMLISPLMGTIVGAGFSLATHNFELLKKSLLNLSYAVAISIVTSTLFFLFSPENSAQSELLARTQPTFFDVLIAFFGGAAGIVASTRKVKSNAIPGVAIATALMPPLCTIGFGLAHLDFHFIFGAFYLFTINATFILISTYLFVQILGFEVVIDKEPKKDKLIHKWMTYISIAVVLPSIYLAWYLHKKTQFENEASKFIDTELNLNNSFIASKEINYSLNNKTIKIKFFGEPLSEAAKKELDTKIHSNSALRNAQLKIEYIGRDSFSVSDLEQKFVSHNELIQVIKNELSKDKYFYDEKSAEIKKQIEKVAANSIADIKIDEHFAEIIWLKKPSKKKLQEIEKIVSTTLAPLSPVMIHTILVKE